MCSLRINFIKILFLERKEGISSQGAFFYHYRILISIAFLLFPFLFFLSLFLFFLPLSRSFSLFSFSFLCRAYSVAMSNNHTRELFEVSMNYFKEREWDLRDDQRGTLYGLAKQATSGDCTTDAPLRLTPQKSTFL